MIIQHDQSCLPKIDEYELVIDLVEELLDAMDLTFYSIEINGPS